MRHDVNAVDVPLPRTSRTFTDPQWLAPPLGVFSFTGSRYQRIEVSRPPLGELSPNSCRTSIVTSRIFRTLPASGKKP
jgi:hypothetical protein